MVREIKTAIKQVKKYTDFANEENKPNFSETVIEAAIMVEIFHETLNYDKRIIKKKRERDENKKTYIPDITLFPTLKEKLIVEIKLNSALKGNGFKNALNQIANYIVKTKQTLIYGILTSGREWYLFMVKPSKKRIKLLLKFNIDDKIAPKILMRMQKSKVKNFFEFLEQIHYNLDKKRYDQLTSLGYNQIVNELLKQTDKDTSVDRQILKYVYLNESRRRAFILPILEEFKITKR